MGAKAHNSRLYKLLYFGIHMNKWVMVGRVGLA
jgi:hypothetical protein